LPQKRGVIFRRYYFPNNARSFTEISGGNCDLSPYQPVTAPRSIAIVLAGLLPGLAFGWFTS
jgi:hypothetical protein